MSASWTQGWRDRFCIIHFSYSIGADESCFNASMAGDMADLYGDTADCEWALGRVVFDEEAESESEDR